MICPNCGKEIADQCKFCTNCGNKIEQPAASQNVQQTANQQPVSPQIQYSGSQQYSQNSNQNSNNNQYTNNNQFANNNMPYQAPPVQAAKPKKKHTALKVLAVVMALIIAFCGVGTAFYFTSAGVKSVNYLRQAQYTAATDEYNNRAADSSLQKMIADPLLTDYVSEVKSAYDTETITGNTALANLQAIKDMNDEELSTLASDVYTAVNTNENSKTAYAAAQLAYAGGNYAEAISQYVLVDENYINYADAQTKLNDAATKLASSFQDSLDDADSADDYEDVIDDINTALEYLPDDMKSDAQDKLATAIDSYVSCIGDEFDTAIANYEGYSAAFDIIDEAIKNHADMQGLKDLRDEKITEFEDLVLTTMDSFVANGYYAAAKDLLEAAADIAPESTKLQEYLATHGDDWITGVSELDCTYWGAETYFVPENKYVVDVFGEEYVGGNTIVLSPSDLENDDAMFIIDLGGDYTSMSYTISVYDDEDPEYSGSVTFAIIDEDYNYYDSIKTISKTSKSQTRVVDVTDAGEILFIAAPSDEYSSKNISIIISDIYFISE